MPPLAAVPSQELWDASPSNAVSWATPVSGAVDAAWGGLGTQVDDDTFYPQETHRLSFSKKLYKISKYIVLAPFRDEGNFQITSPVEHGVSCECTNSRGYMKKYGRLPA